MEKEFFYKFGDTEDKPCVFIYAEEYWLFVKEFDCIYNDWVQNYLNNIEVECTLITNEYKTDYLNKQSWIKLWLELNRDPKLFGSKKKSY